MEYHKFLNNLSEPTPNSESLHKSNAPHSIKETQSSEFFVIAGKR